MLLYSANKKIKNKDDLNVVQERGQKTFECHQLFMAMNGPCNSNDDLNDSRFSGQTAQKVIMSEHQWRME